MNHKNAVRMFLVAALMSFSASAATYTRLIAPEGLNQGDMLVSANGKYRALLQNDGNLVVSRLVDNALVWANYAYGTTFVVVQPDGNFVAYNTSTHPATAPWNSQTAGKAGAGPMPVSLSLANDGSLVLRGTGGSEIWKSPPDFTCPGGVKMTLFPFCFIRTNSTLSIPGCSYSDASDYAWSTYGNNVYPGVCR
ncbi:MAG: hypothetical protein ABW123_18450 [Cystobacter sp.]